MVEKWPKTPKQFHWLSKLLMGSLVSDFKSYKNALYCMTSEPLQLITIMNVFSKHIYSISKNIE